MPRPIFLALAFFLSLACTALAPASVTTIDACDDPSAWKVITADGVRMTIATEPTADGTCLRLDYDFVTGAGYALIRRDLALDLPANYELAFHVRGEGPANNLETKLVDPSGENVWWVNRRAFEWPRDWKRLVNKRRTFEFAWGPSNGAPLTRTGALEIVIASSSGGKGTVWLDDITFRELPPPSTEPLPSPTITQQGNIITLDLTTVREFGGVDLTWSSPPDVVTAESSDDARTWTQLSSEHAVVSDRTLLITPDAEARFIRLRSSPRPSGEPATGQSHVPVTLTRATLRPPEFASSPNAPLFALAKEAPRGLYPRQFLGEQSYWTVVGAPDDTAEALLNEEGQLELWKRGASIEPFLVLDGKLLTWADATHTQSLADNHLPLPTVRRTHESWTLDVSPWVERVNDVAFLFCEYSLTNTSTRSIEPKLVLALRPFQVNPPWQRLNFEGGWSDIRQLRGNLISGSESIAFDNAGKRRVLSPGGECSGTLVEPFDAGDIIVRAHTDLTRLKPLPSPFLGPGDNGPGPDVISRMNAQQPYGMSNQPMSGAMIYEFTLAPGASTSVTIATALHTNATIDDDFDTSASRARTLAAWRQKLSRVQLHVPRDAQWIADTFTSQLGSILVNRDGPAIQPGSRSYERSWARDGSMTTAALLECGYNAEARAWIDWFATHIFGSGKVPCVVDSRGPDPVPEHDSHGQYIWAVANYYAHTRDLAFLREHYPRVLRVVDYIKSLRAQRMTPEFADSASSKHVFYGLVPESISHEGYSAKPMHSYWDNFFVLLGLKEAARLADAMGDDARAKEFAALASSYRTTFAASMQLAMRQHSITYAPGCAELGDFDATSTTIAMFPCDEPNVPPPGVLEATFEKYWHFVDERSRSTTWDAYTPYEVRSVGAFIRLGQRDRAHALLNFLHQHQRPRGWNHWAEVVWREPLTPKFIGDMPHTWVGSDFLNSARAIFLIDSPSAITLFPGVPASWIDSGERIGFTGFVTPFGPLDASLQREGETVRVTVTGSLTMPPAGITIAPVPGFRTPTAPIHTLPATLTFQRE